MKLNRNDCCWCGSGKKYKKCHMELDEKIHFYAQAGHHVPPRHILKTPEQIEKIKQCATLNTAVLDHVAQHIALGMTTEEIHQIVDTFTREKGGIPAPLHYKGFPKSVCTSLNHEVCHGIPSSQVRLKSGDILNVDVTTMLDGYYADASRMFLLGDVDAKAQNLVRVAQECRQKGVEVLKPWGFLGDAGEAITTHAEAEGYSVVRDFGGHGIGLAFHEVPFISHVSKKGTDMLLVPGMVFTIEPMINQGTYQIRTDEKNGWTIYTKDGKLSAQWESTVLITETGVEELTC